MKRHLHAIRGSAGAIPLVCASVAIMLWGSPSLGEPSNSWNLENVRIDQHVGDCLPPDLVFTDEHGEPVQLGTCFQKRPAILVLAYYTCPNLCPMLLTHLTQGLNGIALVAGRDFDVLVVSIDPAETLEAARQSKSSCLRAYRSSGTGNGWHFLIGQAQSIDRLKQAVGFHSTFDPQRKQFAHALGAMVIAPGGRLSHYFYGVDFAPAALDSALRDAAAGRTTRVNHPEQQYCCDYSPAGTRYGRLAVHALQVTAVVWVLLLLGYIGRQLLRERRTRQHRDPRAGHASSARHNNSQGVQP